MYALLKATRMRGTMVWLCSLVLYLGELIPKFIYEVEVGLWKMIRSICEWISPWVLKEVASLYKSEVL